MKSAGALWQRLRAAFPDREFIMRSQGQVRFIRVSSRVQKIAAGAALGAAVACSVSIASLTVSHFTGVREVAALESRAAAVAKAESRVARYGANVDRLTHDLARRQQFIEQMIDAHVVELPEDGATAADAPTTLPARVAAPNAAPANAPRTAALRRLEAEQISFVERLTRYADARATKVTSVMRKLGLNPSSIAASARTEPASAMGGPLDALATGRNGELDPRFRRLGQSLARLGALENGLAALPQVSPAHVDWVSSSYGYRSDPFTGAAAFHAGLDFPGPMGSPIYAAAQGKVTFVGHRQGYGNTVEITHANGLMTRYGHLSGFRSRVGQKVDAGAVIATMGSTGRSTGSHLHFEVRIHDRPVNPRPFLEAARKAQPEAR